MIDTSASTQVIMPAQGFQPRSYQIPLWKFIMNGGRRAVLCLPRRHGKDISCINLAACMSLRRVGMYIYLFPYQNQARRVVWNGIDSQGRRFLHAWPKEVVSNKSESEMRLHLKNGSIIQVLGGDDPDKLVGMNPVGVVFSEYAMCDPMCWKLISPILNENQGWAIFNSTPRGQNHFSKILKHAQANPCNDLNHPQPNEWYWQHETAKTLKVLTPEELRQMRDELQDEALFQQEAFCSFTSPMQGSYYDRQMKYLRSQNRITKVPPETRLPCHTAWDLGIADSTVIWFFQQYGQEVRVINHYEMSGESLSAHIRYLKEYASTHNLTYGKHYAPHDIAVREFTSGKSRIETARELGLRFEPVQKHSVEDGIEAVRNILQSCWFDGESCERGLDALTSYRKEWDSSRACFKSRPVHDWTSHSADAFRILAWGIRRSKTVDAKKQPTQYLTNDYDPFAF